MIKIKSITDGFKHGVNKAFQDVRGSRPRRVTAPQKVQPAPTQEVPPPYQLVSDPQVLSAALVRVLSIRTDDRFKAEGGVDGDAINQLVTAVAKAFSTDAARVAVAEFHCPNLFQAISEIDRVLNTGGYQAVEFGSDVPDGLLAPFTDQRCAPMRADVDQRVVAVRVASFEQKEGEPATRRYELLKEVSIKGEPLD